ncbi:protein SHQ1 homolog [Petromyzon marinus]|nr:protein SHQ1 homolog isoform X2 [Petromyzon marinus]XP_032822397.1 protein SHQ1 homolog isoform X2 [Petromyzon marinus]
MLTPAFELSQDTDHLTVTIRVPYARVSELDLYIDGHDFKFYAKPYFLRLNLPGRIIEDGREKASYDAEKGVFTIRVPKESPGEHFEGLDMLTALLAPRGSRSAKTLVNEMGTLGESQEGVEEHDEEEDDEEEFDWQVEQKPYEEPACLGGTGYGFGGSRTGVFHRLQEELSDVIDLQSPESSTAAQRRALRLQAEDSKFDADHYLADYFEDEPVMETLSYRPWWDGCDAGAVPFTEEDKEQLRRFTNKSFVLDRASRRQAYLGMVDIILAVAYDVRITGGESHVEGPWNIRKLSGTLCWFETYETLQEVLVSFARRVLCYPLYRHFGLVLKVVEDAARIFALGRQGVMKCLLATHKLFRENDPAYILNDIYITDYCIWVQKTKPHRLLNLADALRKAKISKEELGFDLLEEERIGLMVQKEQEEEKELNVEIKDADESAASGVVSGLSSDLKRLNIHHDAWADKEDGSGGSSSSSSSSSDSESESESSDGASESSDSSSSESTTEGSSSSSECEDEAVGTTEANFGAMKHHQEAATSASDVSARSGEAPSPDIRARGAAENRAASGEARECAALAQSPPKQNSRVHEGSARDTRNPAGIEHRPRAFGAGPPEARQFLEAKPNAEFLKLVETPVALGRLEEESAAERCQEPRRRPLIEEL